jgi:integrase
MRSSQEASLAPWNHGRIIGPKPPLKPKHIWAIRTRLQHEGRTRDLAMFNVAIDSKLRGCDLVRLRVSDIHLGDSIRLRTIIVQQKTGRPVPFELTESTREALGSWLRLRGLRGSDWLFPSRSRPGDHLTTRQYGRLLDDWVALIGLDPAAYGTHSLRRTKWHSYTSEQATSAPASSCSATPSWRALSETSGSRWTTPWSYPSRSTSERKHGGSVPP